MKRRIKMHLRNRTDVKWFVHDIILPRWRKKFTDKQIKEIIKELAVTQQRVDWMSRSERECLRILDRVGTPGNR
jgi:hypothetical protein